MAFDAVVVGSGFGGAVASLRLAEAGMSVLVLERGRRWDNTNFPRKPEDPWLWSHASPETRNGWLDLRVFANMTVAQGAAVGGGSQIYANISVEAPRASFASGWPPEIGYDVLKPYYDRVADMMEVRAVPDGQWTGRMKLMRDAAVAAGYGERFRPVDLAVRFDPGWTYRKGYDKGADATVWGDNKHGARQGTCVHLGECDIGCPVLARNTLDLNYLYVAENRHHVEVRPLHLVDCIEPAQAGWRVHFDRLENGARPPPSFPTHSTLSRTSFGSGSIKSAWQVSYHSNELLRPPHPSRRSEKALVHISMTATAASALTSISSQQPETRTIR
jgi:cholesterol oxidase